jgi:thioredoxin 1
MFRKSGFVKLALLLAILACLAGCGRDQPREEAARGDVDTETGEVETEEQPQAALPPEALPKMIDLGAQTCLPCRMMEPILEELKVELEGKAIIEVIDLGKNREAARTYRIRVIPTQIFFDPSGKQVWRHEGYMPKDAILKKFEELGVRPLDG